MTNFYLIKIMNNENIISGLFYCKDTTVAYGCDFIAVQYYAYAY